MENINWISLLLTAITPMVIGFIWYSRPLFGNTWMKAVGMTEEKMKSANMGLTYGLAFLMSLVLTFFLLGFNNSPGQEGEFDTFKHGMTHGAILLVFLVAPILITKKLFEQSSWTDVWISLGYWLVTLCLMGGIVDVMNHFPNS